MAEAVLVDLQPIVEYADGGTALIRDMVSNLEKEDMNGIKRIYNIFYLKPFTKVRIEHSITEKDETFQNSGKYMGFYKRVYLQEWCVPLSQSTLSPVWFLFTDWKGNKFIDPFNSNLRKVLDIQKHLQKENIGLRRQVSSLQFENIKISRNVLDHEIKKGEKMNKLMKTSTIVVGGEDKGQGEGYGGQ